MFAIYGCYTQFEFTLFTALKKILLSWILLKWPPCTAPLWKWPPAKFSFTPFLHPHRFPFEESRSKVSTCPIVLSASLRTMNSRCYGPFCGWGWGRGAWLAIGDAWNPEKSIELYWSPKKLQIKLNSNRHVHTIIPCLHIAWLIEAGRGKRIVIY